MNIFRSKSKAQDHGGADTAISDAEGSLQSLSAAADFLQRHAPYSEMDRSAVVQMLSQARLRFFPASSPLQTSESAPRWVGVVQQGLIKGHSGGQAFMLGAGDTVFHVALWENRPSRADYCAENDSFIIEIPAEDFRQAINANSSLQAYCESRASELISLSREQRQLRAMRELQGLGSMDRPVREMASAPALNCSPDTPVQDAVRRMHDAGVGSILIADADGPPLGIFTLHDLRALVAAGTGDLGQAIRQCMSADPLCIDAETPAYVAAATMTEHRIQHLPVLQGQRLFGLVSERDLFGQQSGDLVALARRINKASDVAELRDLHLRVQELSRTLLARGANAGQLSGMITQLNDTAVRRCIDLLTESRPWPGQVAWIAFGSEARGEQSLATDQDNGLLLLDQAATAAKSECLGIARAINEALDDIGFPLCRGNTMASNPELCLPLQTWSARYTDIIQSPSRQHLLDATILFDARVITGPAKAFNSLFRDMTQQAQRQTRFLHALARHALEWRPALGLLGRLQLDAESRIDLKKSAIQPIVAAARVLALAKGITAINTEERLQALGRQGHLDTRDVRAWSEALDFIQLQRMLLNRRQADKGEELDNKLQPATLNPLDQRILREALRQIGRLQKRLDLDFPAR